jgi:hypothetical protein
MTLICVKSHTTETFARPRLTHDEKSLPTRNTSAVSRPLMGFGGQIPACIRCE